MTKIIDQSQTETKTQVRQLSVSYGTGVAGFYNVANHVEVELEALATWLNQNQAALVWEESLTQKGKKQLTCKTPRGIVLGWYQPGNNAYKIPELKFNHSSKITSLDALL